MQNDKLLPCPFCGGEAKAYKNVAQTCFGVGCTNEKCAVNSPYLNFDTPEEAVEAWNTRKPMERIVEQLEEKSNDIPIQYENNYEQGYANGIDYAVDVVKKGGVDNATN